MSLLVMGVVLLANLVTGTARVEPSSVSSDKETFRVLILAEPLERPWGLAFPPAGDLLVTERLGRLRIVHGRELDPDPVEDLPEIVARGQGGLLTGPPNSVAVGCPRRFALGGRLRAALCRYSCQMLCAAKGTLSR